MAAVVVGSDTGVDAEAATEFAAAVAMLSCAPVRQDESALSEDGAAENFLRQDTEWNGAELL